MPEEVHGHAQHRHRWSEAGIATFLTELERADDDAWVLLSPESTLRYAEGVAASGG